MNRRDQWKVGWNIIFKWLELEVRDKYRAVFLCTPLTCIFIMNNGDGR